MHSPTLTLYLFLLYPWLRHVITSNPLRFFSVIMHSPNTLLFCIHLIRKTCLLLVPIHIFPNATLNVYLLIVNYLLTIEINVFKSYLLNLFYLKKNLIILQIVSIAHVSINISFTSSKLTCLFLSDLIVSNISLNCNPYVLNAVFLFLT